MRNMLFLAFTVSLVCCKQTPNKINEVIRIEEAITVSKTYPENISKIFKAHGGIDTWNTMESLVFEMEIPEGKELTTTNLKNRKSLIETDKFKIGFDGNNVWIQQDSMAFKGNAKFYYNLMFYFSLTNHRL